MLFSTIGAGLNVLLIWGLAATNLAWLLVFSIVNGLCSGGGCGWFSCGSPRLSTDSRLRTIRLQRALAKGLSCCNSLFYPYPSGSMER